MRVVYVGPAGEGVTLAPSHGGTFFPHGEAVEVPEGLGRRLIEQAIFVPETPERPRRGAASIKLDVEARSLGQSSETRHDPEREDEADSDHDHRQR